MKTSFSSLAFLMFVGVAFVGCGDEPIPDNVSYAHDIKPLMEARCIRCHGAGGTLNKEPGLPAWFVAKYGDTPKASNFTTFTGIMTYAPLLKAYLSPVAADSTATPPTPAVDYLMPPPPGPPLTTRERNMLLQWVARPLP